jgi:hypothetical protein
MTFYAKWKLKPENEQSTEEPATVKQRLYSEFEESKKGSTMAHYARTDCR